MQKNYIIEVALVETALFLTLWLFNPYIAFLLTLFFTGISFFVLLIALTAELLERTKITRAYFLWMGISIIVPLVVAGFFVYTGGGSVADWL